MVHHKRRGLDLPRSFSAAETQNKQRAHWPSPPVPLARAKALLPAEMFPPARQAPHPCWWWSRKRGRAPAGPASRREGGLGSLRRRYTRWRRISGLPRQIWRTHTCAPRSATTHGDTSKETTLPLPEHVVGEKGGRGVGRWAGWSKSTNYRFRPTHDRFRVSREIDHARSRTRPWKLNPSSATTVRPRFFTWTQRIKS